MSRKSLKFALVLFSSVLISAAPARSEENDKEKEKKVETKELGFVDKFNLMRKMVSVGSEAKAAKEVSDGLQKEVEDLFTLEKIDEPKLMATEQKWKASADRLSETVFSMFKVLAEVPMDLNSESTKTKFNSDEPEAVADNLSAAVPASFSPEKIKKVREIKARNKTAREDARKILSLAGKEGMLSYLKSTPEEKAKTQAVYAETYKKMIDLDIAEAREMRTFLNGGEMKTYYTLRRQMKEKLEKELAAKRDRRLKEAKDSAAETESKG